MMLNEIKITPTVETLIAFKGKKPNKLTTYIGESTSAIIAIISTIKPPNLSGIHLINPKKVKKNHSGIILSGVLSTFVNSKLS